MTTTSQSTVYTLSTHRMSIMSWVQGIPSATLLAAALIRRADGQPQRALLIYNVDPIQPRAHTHVPE